MKTTDIGTGRLTEVARGLEGWRVTVHPDGETPSYHNVYPITEDMARIFMGIERGTVCWVGKRVMVRREEDNLGRESFVFQIVSEESVPESPGDIRKLREEWAAMRKELDARTEAVQGPLLEKLRRAENDITCLRIIIRDRDAALEAVKKALQVRS